MSAFLCGETHINAIVTYAAAKQVYVWNEREKTNVRITSHNAEEIGRILLDENVRSICHRYTDTGTDEKNAAASYRFKPYRSPLSAVQVIKACHCLDYQSCETQDWDSTFANAILLAIISHATSNLPGYDAAAWHIDEDCVQRPTLHGARIVKIV